MRAVRRDRSVRAFIGDGGAVEIHSCLCVSDSDSAYDECFAVRVFDLETGNTI